MTDDEKMLRREQLKYLMSTGQYKLNESQKLILARKQFTYKEKFYPPTVKSYFNTLLFYSQLHSIMTYNKEIFPDAVEITNYGWEDLHINIYCTNPIIETNDEANLDEENMNSIKYIAKNFEDIPREILRKAIVKYKLEIEHYGLLCEVAILEPEDIKLKLAKKFNCFSKYEVIEKWTRWKN